ncbi:MAG TPA: hypothetical protein VMO00_04580 [Methylomirabilota bacterium]|nr:hypothetical protein [Methylomirabilota bacterium]
MPKVTDSIIISLFALRALKGDFLSRVSDSILIAFLALTTLTGCSAQSTKTVETEKTVRYSTTSDQAATDPVVEQKTTKTEETTRTAGESAGLLRGTVHVVGQAIALPFRVVGELIGLIF